MTEMHNAFRNLIVDGRVRQEKQMIDFLKLAIIFKNQP